ncbi:MAG: hypothetical protein JWN77_50 [Frankiales bacterium]|jgi:hypothetical protein|nr:hypothetical protein [Frankiales bacterium]
MPFTVLQPGRAPVVVEAEEHRVEGAWHVFRRTTTVMGSPRTVVALRLPAAPDVVVRDW